MEVPDKVMHKAKSALFVNLNDVAENILKVFSCIHDYMFFSKLYLNQLHWSSPTIRFHISVDMIHFCVYILDVIFF